MKIIIEDVILSSRFELSDMLRKVDILWIQGELTDEDKDALEKMAQAHATPENSYAPLQQMDVIAAQLKDLKKTVEDKEYICTGGMMRVWSPVFFSAC